METIFLRLFCGITPDIIQPKILQFAQENTILGDFKPVQRGKMMYYCMEYEGKFGE